MPIFTVYNFYGMNRNKNLYLKQSAKRETYDFQEFEISPLKMKGIAFLPKLWPHLPGYYAYKP